MSTGILSLDLRDAGWVTGSRGLFVCAAAVWLALLVKGELSRHLAAVPATGVIASRATLAGWPGLGVVLLAAGSLLLVRRIRDFAVPARVTGSGLLPVVALQSLSVLSATLARATSAPWLQVPAVALAAAGVVQYVRSIPRFRVGQLARGAGDQWIAGGALAISGLACAQLASDGALTRALGVALWAVAILWLPALVAGELAHPRTGAAGQRWSTVFPIGMYAALTFAVADSAGLAWLRHAGEVGTACGLLAWALVLAFNLALGARRLAAG
jgi:Voltage-dependent anion channel